MLQLMEVKSGKVVVQLFQKTMSKDTWPALQLTSDESHVAHMVNNTVNIYSTTAFSEGLAHQPIACFTMHAHLTLQSCFLSLSLLLDQKICSTGSGVCTARVLSDTCHSLLICMHSGCNVVVPTRVCIAGACDLANDSCIDVVKTCLLAGAMLNMHTDVPLTTTWHPVCMQAHCSYAL